MKEFKLIEKRKELKKQDFSGCPQQFVAGWLSAIKEVEKQDKEFIRLRDELIGLFFSKKISRNEFVRRKNKLSGDLK